MSVQRARGGRSNGGDSKGEVSELTNSRLIRAIQESTSHKLASINALLQTVVQAAKTVVKGTDSQRRFNAQFSEFCRASLVGIADLEEAVYTLEKADGIVDNESRDDQGVKGIRTTDFVKEIAVFIASQTNALGAQYLEHVGMSAVTAAAKMQQQRTTTETKRGTKRGRVDSSRQRDVDCRSSPRKRLGASPSLLPMWETEAPSLSLPPNKSGRGTGGATDSHHGDAKLSGIPELSTWLQPWNLPLPNAHGIALDRVTTERPKPLVASEESCKHPVGVSVFDICTALTTADVLSRWEARECSLSDAVSRPSLSNPVPTETVLPHTADEDRRMFFPKSNLGACAWVPTQVMVDLVHYGISSLGMPFKDMV
ncbi:uncharacterized protein Tco025E_04383 [Trypanosoma conorhini]|uniref:Uncharacterized protein n=1 Tax=Trypanosoma conorhini TaxID=83891 RepID=A0A3R7LQ90_9TRYP|nr:uncharacterized protein Tco025E_04383 [Trypanosoma conorhini]RNF18687.1 hypothetical protein Tco025E_04383 [Trypanosoma conorhini]